MQVVKVSVIIPTYNEEEYIEECLSSLVNQIEKADEIIIVNNNSTDNTMAIAKKFPVRIVVEKKQGMIYSRNKGFNAAKYDLILRTDADTRVPKDWVKRIKRKFKDEKLIAVSGPAQFYGLASFVQVKDWPTRFFFRTFKRVLRHDCLFGPNMAIRKSAWEKVKNEVCLEDSVVHEDIDLTIHLARYGKILFDSKLVVNSSFRRWKRLAPYFDYPYRSIRTIQRHKMSLEGIKRSQKMVKKMFSKKNFTTENLKRLVS